MSYKLSADGMDGELHMTADRIAFGRDFFSVDPRKAALIVVDMQNAFVAEAGAYERRVLAR